jgi:hypothetical protein
MAFAPWPAWATARSETQRKRSSSANVRVGASQRVRGIVRISKAWLKNDPLRITSTATYFRHGTKRHRALRSRPVVQDTSVSSAAPIPPRESAYERFDIPFIIIFFSVIRRDPSGRRPPDRRPTHVSIMHARTAGRHYWTNRRDTSRWPADMQACPGVQGGSIFRDAAAIAGAEVDRSRIGRCVTLRTVFCRILRDRVLAAEGKRTRY